MKHTAPLYIQFTTPPDRQLPKPDNAERNQLNVVYIIGNGFDINFGLPTRYSDFYARYVNTPVDNTRYRDEILRFKKELSTYPHNYLWADLERGLGTYTASFCSGKDNIKTYSVVINDVAKNLRDYLLETEGRIDEDKVSSFAPKFKTDIRYPWSYLKARDKQQVQKMLDQHTAQDHLFQIITFNYTDTFERMVSYQERAVVTLGTREENRRTCRDILESITHVHGKLRDSIVFGVNDKSQIANVAWQEDQAVNNLIVKRTVNINGHGNRDEICDKQIKEADVICSFGFSFGETDKLWSERIIRHLYKDKGAIMIMFCPGFVNGNAKESLFRHVNAHNILKEKGGADFNRALEDIKDRIYIVKQHNFLRYGVLLKQ